MADKSEWAMDSFSETKENDPLRLLDLENDAQMLINKVIPGSPTETERATHNFNNMVFGDAKPITDHLVEGAGRVLPTVALGGIDLAVRGLKKVVGKGINKLHKSIIEKVRLKKYAKDQLKALEEKHGKTLIRDLNDKHFKDVKGRYLNGDEKKVLRTEMKNSDTATRNALGDLKNVYEDPRVLVQRKIESYNGTAEEKYKMFLQEKESLVKSTGLTPKELDETAKATLGDIRYRENSKIMGFYSNFETDVAKNPKLYEGKTDEEALKIFNERKALAKDPTRYGEYYENGKKFNLGFTLKSDMAKNPEFYKGKTEEEALKIFNERKRLAEKNGGLKLFDEGLEHTGKLSDEEFDKIKEGVLSPKAIGKQVLRDARIKAELDAPKYFVGVDNDIKQNMNKIHDEPVFKRYTFDKEPDTSFAKAFTDNLLDIIGLDFRNPNRYNEIEIRDFLEFAQKEGLLSNDNWRHWTARQQIEKVDEIAHSPYARNFIKKYEER